MAFMPEVHHRRSIRLKGYDYTSPGAYFITIVTHNRRRLFGNIVHRRMRLSPCGEIVRDTWMNSAIHRPGIVFDAFVVMPDHFHGIVIIRDTRVGDDFDMTTNRRGTACRAPTVADHGIRTAHCAPINATDHDVRTTPHADMATTGRFGHPIPGSIPTIVRSFKSAVTKHINECRGTPGAIVWQRNYYERIIRDEFAMRGIRRYITANPTLGQ